MCCVKHETKISGHFVELEGVSITFLFLEFQSMVFRVYNFQNCEKLRNNNSLKVCFWVKTILFNHKKIIWGFSH